MGDKIRDLEQQLPESTLNPELIKSLNTPKFILQIPGIKENYKLHLDFSEVKGLSDLDSTEYHGSKILKPNEKSELTDKIVRSTERQISGTELCGYEEDDQLASTAISDELALRLCPHPRLGG